MPNGRARGIDNKIIVTFPVPGWADWAGTKSSAAIRAHVVQDVLDAGSAECAFKRANHRRRGPGWKRHIAILASRS